MLAREVVDRFQGRVALVVENWGSSPLAERLGITRYPAVFVDEAIFATPKDLGFFGQAQSGRYTPFRDTANHERFRNDLTRTLERVLAGGAPSAAPATAAAPDAAITALPTFTATALDGRAVSRDVLLGKPLIVEFWATWCPPCLETLPHLDELKRRYGGDLEVVALAIESPEEQVRDVASRLAPGLTTAISTPEIAVAFGDLLAVPTLFVFDSDGRTAEVFYGAAPGLHDKLAEVLKKVAHH